MKKHLLFTTGIAGATAALLAAAPAAAQDFYMGEVQLYAGAWCPRTTMETQNQTLGISQNQALFTLLGVTYGGNGVQTFALPDLRGRSAVHVGQGVGLSNMTLGQTGGVEQQTLTVANLPPHDHEGALHAVAGAPNIDDPTGAALADFPSTNPVYAKAADGVAPNIDMATGTVQTAIVGSSQPVPTLSPFLTMRNCIVTQGLFPSRN